MRFSIVKMSLVVVFSGASMAAVLSGCAEAEQPPTGKLGGLNILAMPVYETTPNSVSEAAPGDTLKVRPFLSWVDGAGKPVTWSIVACRDPGSTEGAPTCNGAPDTVVIPGGTQTTPTVIGNASNAWTDFMPEVSLTIPSNFFSGPPAITDAAIQYNGYSYLVFIRVYGPVNDSMTSAMIRIVVTTRTGTDLAVNPSFDDILANGVSLTTLPTEKVTLQGVFSGLVPSYPGRSTSGSSVTNSNPSLTSWYYSDGSLQRLHTDETVPTTEWTPAGKPANRASILVGVLRDSRGGQSVKQISLP